MSVDTKGALKSTAIRGGLLAALPGILQVLSIFGVPYIPYIELIPEAVNLVITTVGGVIAIVGRAKAETKVKGLF
jgi:hypothetical protein